MHQPSVPPLSLGRAPRAYGVPLPGILLAFGVTVALVNLCLYGPYLLDDTFISLRYARNLVDGHGLVFNLGERVEGYTNFSFVLLAALFMRLGLDPVQATKGVSVAAAVATVLLIARVERLGQRASGATRLLPVSVLLLLPLQAVAYWSVASFETMLFTSLLIAAVACLAHESEARRGHASAAIFVLLALTRPEGVYLFAAGTGVFWLLETLRAPTWLPLRRHAINTVIFAAGIGPYFLWRYQYYGRLVPNTFDAKVTGGWAQVSNGLHHLLDWALAFPLLAAMLLVPVVLLARRGRDLMRSNTAFTAVYLITLAHAAYIVLVGGDFMPFFRFFVPVIPFCCVLLAWTFDAFASTSVRAARFARIVLPVAVLVNFAASHATEQPHRAFVAHRTTLIGERAGRLFHDRLQPDDLMAVNTAGSLPYFSRLATIDMLGLTDAQIARRPIFIISPGWAGHRKGWGAYVVQRRPRVILWYNSAGAREPFYLGDRELADNPLFRLFYRPRAAFLPPAGDGGERMVERFLGNPFDVPGSGHASSGDLGLKAVLVEHPFTHTLLYEGPVTISYFELDVRDEGLWPLEARAEEGIDELVRAVAERWRSGSPGPPPDSEALAEVEGLCDRARRRIEAGDYATAREILADATRRNAQARSPLVYQYVANLAVMTGDLFVAIAAQKEALRLAPDNRLYRRNLSNLLTMPYEQAVQAVTARSG